MGRDRKNKSFNIYFKQDGTPSEHKSSRGGSLYINSKGQIVDKSYRYKKYPLRPRIWKTIMECKTKEEVTALIGTFRKRMKGLDKSIKLNRLIIREYRTAISMAGDWYSYLDNQENLKGKYSQSATNTIIEEDDYDYSEFFELDSESEEIEEESKQQKQQINYYDKEVQYRPYELNEINNRNTRELLKSKPDLKKIYRGWYYKVKE